MALSGILWQPNFEVLLMGCNGSQHQYSEQQRVHFWGELAGKLGSWQSVVSASYSQASGQAQADCSASVEHVDSSATHQSLGIWNSTCLQARPTLAQDHLRGTASWKVHRSKTQRPAASHMSKGCKTCPAHPAVRLSRRAPSERS
ncbi:hypothetical protein KFL_011560015 [Klebsormidium nitens]|uniref:Uncharacterized protein n=1 Tax=Klebsormidium nitens TaxID=105231 RepID=A0A1Y1IU04_KLENI|nr:hypothetical protein KFL_011560015 [Klebsormidium nitens]|eukprot:GAQ92821.1 hypothetical protein KFL_011560015 [Klebsormidium nitens]